MSKRELKIVRTKKLAHNFKNKLQKPLNLALRGKKCVNDFSCINVSDFADLIVYCNLITDEKLSKAYNMQHDNLDTAVYEVIPDQLYELLRELVVGEDN